MKNDEIGAAWAYHNGTKHSLQSIRANHHYLDWENQPFPFKIYPNLEPIPLPHNLTSPGTSALLAISGFVALDHPAALTRQTLAEILFLSAGITRRRSYPGGEILFRAAACTGALYHIDLYCVCGDLEDVKAGVYHFSPQDFALRQLRGGDYRSVLVAASGEEAAIATAPCIIACASTFWRNAWKYQARAYRHCFWDSGTILANLLAAASARKLPAKLVVGFVDEAVSQLIGLDTRREAPISLVALGAAAHAAAARSLTVETLHLETVPLSKTEVDYPAMRAMHEASALDNAEEVKAWRDGRETSPQGEERMKNRASGSRVFPLQPLDSGAMPGDTVEDVIVRRGSTREFACEPITFAQLSTVLDRATRGIPADFLAQPETSLNDIYLIVHAVEELPSGAYAFRRDRALELLKPGDFRRDAGYLGLNQEIPADCSVNIYLLADLNRAFARFGNRGYRAAQLEAAVVGGKIYLAAYAQRLGASGLTFFDDDVTEFFSPHAAGKSVMFLVALGKSAKKRS